MSPTIDWINTNIKTLEAEITTLQDSEQQLALQIKNAQDQIVANQLQIDAFNEDLKKLQSQGVLDAQPAAVV